MFHHAVKTTDFLSDLPLDCLPSIPFIPLHPCGLNVPIESLFPSIHQHSTVTMLLIVQKSYLRCHGENRLEEEYVNSAYEPALTHGHNF